MSTTDAEQARAQDMAGSSAAAAAAAVAAPGGGPHTPLDANESTAEEREVGAAQCWQEFGSAGIA